MNNRAAWLDVMGTMLKHYPKKLDTKKDTLIRYAFSNLNELNPVLVHQTWETVVLIQNIYEDW